MAMQKSGMSNRPSWFKTYLKSIYGIHSACLAWNMDRSVSENIKQARDEKRRGASRLPSEVLKTIERGARNNLGK
jgi:hypothetical protein